MNNKVLKIAALNAFGTTAYIATVVSLIFYAPKTIDEKATVFLPMAMLLLFVISASITGSLVFGRPILWYMDGKKKEAIALLIATLAFLAVVTLTAFISLIIFNR